MPETDYLTRRQAADLLKVHVRTLDRWARNGKITTYRTPGGLVRFRLVDVQALAEPVPDPPASVHIPGQLSIDDARERDPANIPAERCVTR